MKRTTQELFWAKVDQPCMDGCWEWQGGRYPNGYGNFGNRRGVSQLAHRTCWELTFGPIPEGLTIDHLCRNKLCQNPQHLELVSLGENGRRGSPYTSATHCKRGHPFTEENTYIRPDGKGRDCRKCKADRKQRYKKERANA